ncbi:MAG TPA: cation:proton antiporter [Solirubrobacteraceae bacterium]|nr:cation:proton antiporter [Solirubrobacteraceae bacterium]
MTTFVFVVVGANLPLAVLPDHALPALAVIGVLVLVARPLTVPACALPDRRARRSREELAFLAWTRETGVLVGVLPGLGVPDADVLAGVVALAIIVTLLAQVLPALGLARRLGLLEPRAGPDA